MIRKEFLIAGVLTVAGLAGGIWLFPGKSDMARMEVRDYSYNNPEALYEKRFTDGDHSAEVVQQLVRIHTSTGHIDRAITVMETYVNENPKDGEALKQLGKLYQYAQRYQDYMTILEKRASEGDDLIVLSEMSQLYNFFQQLDKQRDTLKRIYALEKGSNPDTIRSLVIFYNLDKDFENAARLLEDLRVKHPNAYDDDMAISHMNALLRQQKTDESVVLAKLLVKENRTPALKATLVDMLHYQAAPRYAEEIMADIPAEQINGSAELLHSKLLLLLAQGKQTEAYGQLTALYDTGKLPAMLMPDLMYLASVRGDNQRFDKISKQAGFGQLTENQLADIYALARRNNQKGILQAIERHISSASPETYPLMRTLIAIREHSPSRHGQIKALLASTQDNETLFKLAEATAEAGDSNYARETLAKLPPMENLSISELATLEVLYLRLNDIAKAKILVAYAESSGKQDTSGEIGLRTAAATGDAAKLRNWHLAKSGNLNNTLHDDLFYQAANRGHLQLALEIADWQDNPTKSAVGRQNIAGIYARLGRYEDALALLEKDAPKTEAEKRNRVFLAAKLASKSPAHRQKLQVMARQWFPGGSKETREDIVYALMASNEPVSALPYMKPMADHYGGEWLLTYADASEKAGKIDEATQYRLKAARDPHFSPETKLSLAYALADRGYRQEAEGLLMELAKQPALKMQAIEALAYIWGPHPTDSQLSWLIVEWKQTKRKEDKAVLAEIISGKLPPDMLETYVAQHAELRTIPAVEKDYLQILAEDGKLQPEIELADQAAQEDKDVRRLVYLGDLARANGGYKQSRDAYDRALKLDQQNGAALIGGTIGAAAQSDYRSSDAYFNRYLALQKDEDKTPQAVHREAYAAYFAYGENLRRGEKLNQAQPYYQQAFDTAGTAPATPEKLSIAAQAAAWLGDRETSDRYFDQAFGAYPNNRILRADKANLLIEQKRYKEARKLLESIPANEGNAPKELRASLINSQDGGMLQSPDLFKGDQVVLVHTRPETVEPRHWLPTVRNHPSVSYVTEGYDTVLIVAKQGYLFQKTEGERAWQVSAKEAGAQSYRSEAAQLALRKELLQARIDLETGKLGAASDRIAQLEENYKEDPQYLGFAANTYYYNGIWPAAKDKIEQATAKSPDNYDIARMKRTIEREHPNHARADVTLYKRGTHRDVETRLSGETHMKGPWTLGGSVSNHDLKTRRELLRSGATGSRKGERQNAHIYGIYSDNGHSMWTGSLYANNNTVGSGLEYDFVNRLGLTTLTAEYHKPYQEFVEGILDDAVRDRLAVYHRIKPATDWEVGLGGSLNNYSTDFEDDVFKSAGIDLNVVHAIRLERPYIGIGYGLMAEYELDSNKQETSLGQIYRQLPLRSREIHFGSVTFAHNFSERTYGSVLAGYGWDRLGGHGPALEANINHEFYRNWDLGARAYYGLSTTNSATDDDLSILNAYLRRRF